MKGLTLTVTQLNEYVRRTFASDPMLHGICLTGELSNLKRHASGHWYFTLKDDEAAINCAMFRQAAFGLRFRPENGQRVRVFGSVGLYAKTGSYQFYADAMEPDGLGDLYLRFEALKRKLTLEGLFDPSIKKPLPVLPKGIGIVTSKTGAVVHDIARVAWRRYPGMPLYLFPVKVQGEGAAQEIARGLRVLDKLPEIDVLIVGRGGGSMEDLWAFNEEIVARTIAACKTPVVSAVGHETDFTIADMVADLRAPTPSAAAELAVPEKDALTDAIAALKDDLTRALEQQIARKRLKLTVLQQRLAAASPAQRSERLRASLAALEVRLNAAVSNALQQKQNRVERAKLRIRASGPMETMKRGYAVVMKKDSLVRSASGVNAGDALRILLADGTIEAVAQSVKSDQE
ncbi:MAG: exodeoxyribonuclease VII large subunit [Clostridia bacterium]|nr:exodeoxyribonuclease VII large subunit [Clostridia bacterium]